MVKEVKRTAGGAEKLNSILVENFVNLQKAVTNLAVKFDSLSEQISKLLQLFEISARSFSEKISSSQDIEKDREFLDKLDKLLEQNKVIAKGITLMEEKVREKIYNRPVQFAPRHPITAQPPYQPQQQSNYSYLQSIKKPATEEI